MPLPMRLLPLTSCTFAVPMFFSGPCLARTLLSQLQDRYSWENEGDLLIFQQDLLLEEVAEPLRFGFNAFADRGCG